MQSGVVKLFIEKKGYGFLNPNDENGLIGDIFFHLEDGRSFVGNKPVGRISRVPRKGDKIEFTVTETPKGFKASPWWFSNGRREEVMKKGTILWFNNTRGFGAAESHGNSIFLHEKYYRPLENEDKRLPTLNQGFKVIISRTKRRKDLRPYAVSWRLK